MKLNFRVATAIFTLISVVFITLQLVEVMDQYSDKTGASSSDPYTKTIDQVPCDDRLPVPNGARIRIYNNGLPVRHIAFLKIHKAASGTATSILFRYGMSHDLTFVLPKYLNSISSSDTINDKAIHPRLNKTFDIMTSHVIYNRKAFESYLPSDTVYIGIIREPYQQFKSSMNYMAPKYVYNISKDDPIQQYLKDPLKYEPKRSPRFSWINNRQAVEFGASDDLIKNKNIAEINEYVTKLDKEFDLVLIAEYFDESVVLMKRLLNWKLEDILYRRLHIRGWDRKLTLPRPNDRKLFRKYAAVDYALYDFFYKRMWLQAQLTGDDFYDEVTTFKKVRDEVDDYCKTYPNMTSSYVVEKSDWNNEMKIDKTFCRMIMAEEEDWVEQIGQKQYNITPKSKKS